MRNIWKIFIGDLKKIKKMPLHGLLFWDLALFHLFMRGLILLPVGTLTVIQAV